MGNNSSTERPLQLSNRKDWMSKLSNPENLHLWSISIPGTHHSATSAGLIGLLGNIGVCQTHTITEQLHGGVRYLDLRICDDSKDGNVYISHTYISTLTLSNALQEIKTFLDEFPSEIIIISISQDYHRSLSYNGRQSVEKMIEETFGSKLMHCREISLSIRTLWDNGKQVVITGDILRNSCRVTSSWRVTQSSSLQELVEKLEVYLKRNNDFKRNAVHVLECLLTPSSKIFEKDNANRLFFSDKNGANPLVISKLKSEWKEDKINVLLHDFCNDELLDLIVQKNL